MRTGVYLFKKVFFIVCLFIILGRMELSGQIRIKLIGHADVTGPTTDVWEYVDTAANKYYAIVGVNNGVYIFDVTDPAAPRQTALLNDFPGFDMKVWGKYLYSVTGRPGTNKARIVDISNPANPAIADSFDSAHNIYITNDGLLLAEIPGLKIYDLNPDPLKPKLLWYDSTQGGHDAAVIGNRLYDFHGLNGTNIYDISFSDSLKIQLIGSIKETTIKYNHSGWVTSDNKYLFICDELASGSSPDITIWDISNPAAPLKVGGYNDSSATVHNLYIIGNYAYTSYYTSGFRVFDVSDPKNIFVADQYDTNPETGEGFDGAFGVYPFSKTGNIYVSDETGLYVFTFDTLLTNVEDKHSDKLADYMLYNNYPNPFNAGTVISYYLPEDSNVKLRIITITGEEIVTLMNERQSKGKKYLVWNGKDGKGRDLSSGIYFSILETGSGTITQKMILMK